MKKSEWVDVCIDFFLLEEESSTRRHHIPKRMQQRQRYRNFILLVRLDVRWGILRRMDVIKGVEVFLYLIGLVGVLS
jgi:hypothetical protein